ncbi:MAG TPA: sigma-70 family RNA polymerase sigma factor [Verrucomicrobiae bacterium]|nr:sigma-70 family RNA polymerase sigma factor [Verrucomicrobiae bacterium]
MVNPSEIHPPEAREIPQILEHLFRHESGKMVATLTRIFGIEHLGLAEDVVQEALARALQTWPFYGVPKNPSAWIMRASRNLALDVVRRQKVFREKENEIVRLMERPNPAPDETVFSEQEIADDRLRLMFVCCHPSIPADAQVALALNTLCGFSVTEISRAFLSSEAAIAKRLTRAKQKIREAKIPFEIPAGEELARRLDAVLQSLYLMFNEGYKASTGEKLVREDVCHEAIRLVNLLAGHAAGNRPATHALLALMLLSAARLNARVDGDGNLLRLEEQDRAQWNQPMIARGMFHVARSADGDEITEYHLQAGIAACHCAAKNFDSTNWPRILALYDQLIQLNDSPVIALNRAVAVAHVHGPQAGIQAVESIRDRKSLESYYLLYAVLGEFEAKLNRRNIAANHFRKALELAALASEKKFLSKKLEAFEKSSREFPA